MAWGDVADRAFGHRSDRKAWVHADVPRDRGAVANEEVVVAEHLVAIIDHAGSRGGSDRGATEDVSGGRDPEQRLGSDRLGAPVNPFCELLSGGVGRGHSDGVGVVRILLGGQHYRSAGQAALDL